MTNKGQVTQADRDVVKALISERMPGISIDWSNVDSGQSDDCADMQIIASHRIASTAKLEAEIAKRDALLRDVATIWRERQPSELLVRIDHLLANQTPTPSKESE